MKTVTARIVLCLFVLPLLLLVPAKSYAGKADNINELLKVSNLLCQFSGCTPTFKSLDELKTTFDEGKALFQAKESVTALESNVGLMWEAGSLVSWLVARMAWSGIPSPLNVTNVISIFPILPDSVPLVFDLLYPAVGLINGNEVKFSPIGEINKRIQVGEPFMFVDIRSGVEYDAFHIEGSVRLPEINIPATMRDGTLPKIPLAVMDT